MPVTTVIPIYDLYESGSFRYDYSTEIKKITDMASVISSINSSSLEHTGDYNIYKNIFNICKLNNFIWLREKDDAARYFAANDKNGTINRPYHYIQQNYEYGPASDTNDWVREYYTYMTNTGGSSQSPDSVYILNENNKYGKNLANNYIDDNNNLMHIGLYPTDDRFTYYTLSNKWSYNVSYKPYSMPKPEYMFNNNYSYSYLNSYNRYKDKPQNYLNKYYDGTLIPNITTTEYNNRIKKFIGENNTSNLQSSYLPIEFVGSRFMGSRVTDFDGSSNAQTGYDNLIKDTVASDYQIPGYEWDVEFENNDPTTENYRKRCKYFISNKLDQIYQDAFLILAYGASPAVFKKLEELGFFKWELSDLYDTGNYAVSESRYWRDTRFIMKGRYVTGYSSTHESGGTSIPSTAAYSNFGTAPYMVTRIGKGIDNDLYMIYDVPLVPYTPAYFDYGAKYITKSDFVTLLNIVRSENSHTVQQYNVTYSLEEIQYFIRWLAGNNFHDLSPSSMPNGYRAAISTLINKLNNTADLPSFTPTQFLKYYRAAIGTVWNNMPSRYKSEYGTKVSLSSNSTYLDSTLRTSKLLTSEVFLAINAPGAGGGHGEYHWVDDDIGHGGNCGSSAVIKILLKNINSCKADTILCNIYSSSLGGNPVIMTDYDTDGGYGHPGFPGSDVYVVGYDNAFVIPGGKTYSPPSENRAYGYDELDDENKEYEIISRIRSQRENIGAISTISPTLFYGYSSLENVKLLTSSSGQIGNMLVINPYTKSAFNNTVSVIGNYNQYEADTAPLITLDGLDTSETNYNKWTCGVYNNATITSMDTVFYRAYRPGTPPIVTDLINNLDDPFLECSIAYAANSIFANGGSALYERANGDSDNRNYDNDNGGEWRREANIRNYADGKRGAGGGGLNDSTKNVGFTRSGKGGSMAFRVFWYSPGDNADLEFPTEGTSSGGGSGGGGGNQLEHL